MSNKNEASGESENDEIHWNESSEKWTYGLRLSDIKIVPSSCNDTNYQERIFQFDLLFVSTAETLSVILGDSFVRGRRSRDEEELEEQRNESFWKLTVPKYCLSAV